MKQRILLTLGLLSVALAIFVGFNITHAAPASTGTAPTGDPDAGVACSGTDGASQVGDCNTEFGDQIGLDTGPELPEA